MVLAGGWRIDRDRLDLDGEELPVASAALHFEESRLLMISLLFPDFALLSR